MAGRQKERELERKFDEAAKDLEKRWQPRQPTAIAGLDMTGRLVNEPLPPAVAGPPPVRPVVNPGVATGVSPLAAGILPIYIELPKAGERFVFTKALNVRKEPLTVQAHAVKRRVLNVTRGGLELAVFLVGLVLVWRQLRRERPSSFWTAFGVALMLGSIGHLLIVMRQLHVALALVPPLLVILALVWLAMRLRRRFARGDSAPRAPAQAAPPVIACLALGLFLGGAASGCAAAEVMSAPVSSEVSILSANYDGTVRDRVARMEAVIRVSTSRPNQRVLLFGKDVVVEGFSATPGDVKLFTQGASVGTLLPKNGSATLRVKFPVKVTGDVDKRSFSFAIPPSLTTQLALNIDEPDAMVEAPTAVQFKTTAAPGQTRLEAFIGASERIEVQWTPRVKRVAEIAATVFCQSTSLVSIGGGVVNTVTTLDYQVSQGELRQARVRLPSGRRLMRVDGEHIRTWRVTQEGNEQVLTVELLKGMAPSYRLTVETEQPLAAPPSQARVETPHALDVKRETGWLGLKVAEELSVSVESTKETQKVDVEEFIRAVGGRPDNVSSAYRFLKPDFELVLRVEAAQPQLEAALRNRLHIGAELVSLTAQSEYTIKRAGVFTLRVALPADYRVESVTGGRIAQWVEKTEGGARILEVTLMERTLGRYTLQVTMTKSAKELPKTVEVVGVHPLGVHKLTGFVIVGTEAGVQAKTESLEGLTEVPAATVGESGSALVYKFITSEPTSRAPWKLVVATEALTPWVRAEVVNWVTLSETLVSGRALVRFDIQNAPTKLFRGRVPAAYKNIELSGANIRQRDTSDAAGKGCSVELQSKVMGAYFLTITWDRQWDVKKEGTLELPGVEVMDVERETGAVAVIAPSQFEVSQNTASDELHRADRSELPQWAGRAPETTVLAYNYLRPGYRLVLDVKRHEEAQVLQALVDTAQLRTVVSDDGQMMTEMVLAIRNNARQHLELRLPPKAQVWSVFVDGLPVRPTARAGSVLVPLERTGTAQSLVRVELSYVSHGRFPATRGRVELATPALDVPIKNARWNLYLPPDYRYSKFDGTMVRESVTAATFRTFTVAEYVRAEARNKEVVEEVGRLNVTDAMRELATGNIRGQAMLTSAPRKAARMPTPRRASLGGSKNNCAWHRPQTSSVRSKPSRRNRLSRHRNQWRSITGRPLNSGTNCKKRRKSLSAKPSRCG